MPSTTRAIQPILLEVHNTGIYGHEHSVNWEVPQKICGRLKCINNEKQRPSIWRMKHMAESGLVCYPARALAYKNVLPRTGFVLCFIVVLMTVKVGFCIILFVSSVNTLFPFVPGP